MERGASELNRYPDGGAHALARRPRRAARRRVRGDLRRRRGRRLHRHAEPGDARPGRRDRLRLAVVPELCDLRAQAGRDCAAGSAPRLHATTSTACSRAVTDANEARLRLPPEQPDRDDEHARRARRLLRAGSGARARRRRPGVLRVHRPRGLPGRRRGVRRPRRGCSSCARSRRSTAWPACGSATRSGRREVCAAMAKVRRPFDVVTPAQVAAVASIGEEAELARRRAVNADGPGAPRGGAARATASTRCPAVGNFLYAETGEARGRRAVRAPAARRRDRPAARRVRRADRDPGHRRHTGRARLLRCSARERPRAPVTAAAGSDLGLSRPRGRPATRQLPPALLRHVRLGDRELARADRASGRPLRPHEPLGLVDRRASWLRASCRRSRSGCCSARSSTGSRARA